MVFKHSMKIDGESISFHIIVTFSESTYNFQYTGKVSDFENCLSKSGCIRGPDFHIGICSGKFVYSQGSKTVIMSTGVDITPEIENDWYDLLEYFKSLVCN